MTIIGLDDTDSREGGMCTTYAAAKLACRLREAGAVVEPPMLVRLNPAVEYKTRGNAALTLEADCDPTVAYHCARDLVDDIAETGDPRTHPGLVVAPGHADDVPPSVVEFARRAVQEHLTLPETRATIDECGYWTATWKRGRGLIGALAAVGASTALDEWTLERIAYRERDRWGSPREVNRQSVFEAADEWYPAVWDTVDRTEGVAVCVPRTPCPVLFGIRGDDPAAVRAAASRIQGEPVAQAVTFRTNQGTDAHLRRAPLDAIQNGRAYQVDGTVRTAPETRQGGHVYFRLGKNEEALDCVAFEPTKRFRNRVRCLRTGDTVTVCGEVSDGTLKLEKFAARSLTRTQSVVPTCQHCKRSMESAGRDQGYRCRTCGTERPGRVDMPLERDLELGWYEVPPCARRHIARPLVRGGFDAPVHPER